MAQGERVGGDGTDRLLRALRQPRPRPDWLAFGESLLIVAGTALVALRLEGQAGIENVSLIFVTAVVASAVRGGLGSALTAAVVGSLSYSFFFAEPRLSLHVSRHSELVTLVLFVLVAVICGPLAARLRTQVLLLRTAQADTAALQGLSERLAVSLDAVGAARAVAEELGSLLEARTCVLVDVDEGGELEAIASHPPDAPDVMLAKLTEADLSAAHWARIHRKAAGRFTDTLATTRWWFLPATAEGRCIAVIGARLAEEATAIAPERLRLAAAISQQLVLAMERTRLAADLEKARLQGETERLRNALLSSVSHDLRSPLAAMIGAATSLRAYGAELTPETRMELATTLLEEGQRLDRYIQNLLDMARLGYGGLPLERDWAAAEDILGAALTRLRRYHPDVLLDLQIRPDLPLLYVQPALVEQALFNILQNAAGFSPAGTPIRIEARADGGWLLIDISDRGPGVPPGERSRIFEPFYSAERGDREARGTGLGLSICRGMIEAHSGSVEVQEGQEGVGASFRVRLPVEEPPAGGEE